MDIITLINRMEDSSRRAAALQIIYEEEMIGAEKLQLREGFHELLHRLYERKVRVAMSTRNCADAVKIFLDKAEVIEALHCCFFASCWI